MLLLPLLALLALVTVHELGHLIAARRAGVGVLGFSIGFGPSLYSFTIRGLPCHLRLLPFGGYVSLKTAAADSLRPSNDATAVRETGLTGIALEDATLARRMLINVAGPAINVACGCLLFGFVAALPGGGHDIGSLMRLAWDCFLTPFIRIPQLFGDLFLPQETGGSFTALASVGHNVGTVLRSLHGWAGVVDLAGEGLVFIGRLSIFLGALNLFPLPPMDGGRIVLDAVTSVMPARGARVVRVVVPLAGALIILGVMVADISSDVWHVGAALASRISR